MPVAKTCLPSFLKLMDGVFLQEIGVPSLDRAGANVTGKVRLIVCSYIQWSKVDFKVNIF